MDVTLLELEQAIRERLQHVEDEISSAALAAGRSRNAVRLVVVTKGQPKSVVEVAVRAGARIVGENYAEEAGRKLEALRESPGFQGVEWHMIGHIQSRKAKLVASQFDLIHSVDSTKLAKRLDMIGAALGRKIPVLLEFNIGGEPGKSGWRVADPTAWPALLDELRPVVALPNVETRGLMTMPPLAAVPTDSRVPFRRLRELQRYLAEHVPSANWSELSMGTSGDFTVAVEEGATLVRIGEAILGPRPPKESA